jgi:hypothetical protein
MQIQAFHEGIEKTNRIILGDIVINGFGEQGELVAIGALYMSHWHSRVGKSQ